MRGAAAVAPIYAGVPLTRAVVPADATVYSVGTYDQTLPFYWRRTVQLVAYRGELDYGLRREPRAEISLPQFLERWSAEPGSFAVMERTMFDTLKSQGIPMREIARNATRVLVARS
jgi:hypothetical protein